MGWLRGSTPTIKFKLKNPNTGEYIDLTTIAQCRCAFCQSGDVKFIKLLSDFTISGNELNLHLSESDSLYLDQDSDLAIQMRFVGTNGERFGTNIKVTDVRPILDEIPFTTQSQTGGNTNGGTT